MRTVHLLPKSGPMPGTRRFLRLHRVNYMVIGSYEDESDDIYVGKSVGEIEAGDEVNKYLQVDK